MDATSKFHEHSAVNAPVKINLYLHINGRLANGYHTLESAMRLINYGDTLSVVSQKTPTIRLTLQGEDAIIQHIPSDDRNLVVQAANALKPYRQIHSGLHLTLTKRCPPGTGLGSGSSDAATALKLINQQWRCQLSNQQLLAIATRLGADVPFFLFGRDAVASGIGDQLTALTLPASTYLVVAPSLIAVTANVFANFRLPDTPPASPSVAYALANARNDLLASACACYPEIKAVIDWLANFGQPRLSGSGGAVFLEVTDSATGQAIWGQRPCKQWFGFVAPTCHRLNGVSR